MDANPTKPAPTKLAALIAIPDDAEILYHLSIGDLPSLYLMLGCIKPKPVRVEPNLFRVKVNAICSPDTPESPAKTFRQAIIDAHHQHVEYTAIQDQITKKAISGLLGSTTREKRREKRKERREV